MKRSGKRGRALLGGSLVVLFLQGVAPIALHAAAPAVAIPEGADTAPTTQAMTMTGTGGGKWLVVATTTSVALPSPPSPSAPRIGVPTARDELSLDDTGMTAGDTDGEEGEG